MSENLLQEDNDLLELDTPPPADIISIAKTPTIADESSNEVPSVVPTVAMSPTIASPPAIASVNAEERVVPAPGGEMVFSLKLIEFLGKKCVIVCQNENGPCPLLAIANVLILKRKINLHPGIPTISLAELTQIVANVIFEKIGTGGTPEQIKLLESVLNILPGLSKGLDLNVKYSDVDKFEFTQELSLFDSLGIPVVHGWLPPASDYLLCSTINELSYNQVVEKVVESNGLCDKYGLDARQVLNSEAFSELPEEERSKIEAGAKINAFLTGTASQITYQGLLNLYRFMNDRQLAVFFRNNHFNTLFSYNGQLFILVTDQGYLDEPAVVWELLDGTDGTSDFYDENFIALSELQRQQAESLALLAIPDTDPKAAKEGKGGLSAINLIPEALRPKEGAPIVVSMEENPLHAPPSAGDRGRSTSNAKLAPAPTQAMPPAPHEGAVDEDLLLAIRLQEEENRSVQSQGSVAAPSPAQQRPRNGSYNNQHEQSDRELARMLQQQEEAIANENYYRQQQQQAQQRKKADGGCIVS